MDGLWALWGELYVNACCDVVEERKGKVSRIALLITEARGLAIPW